MRMKHPNPEMLLRIAQADAYCLACEYVNYHPEEPIYREVRAFEKFVAHQTYHSTLKPGMYTDDTQMSIAVAEVLIEGNPHNRHGRDFMTAFFDVYKRDPRDGYSRALQSILESATSADHLRSLIQPTSDKNGAAMRSVPIGVFREVDMVSRVAAIQAELTHNTPRGVLSSQAVALMSHYALWTDAPMSQLPNWLASTFPDLSEFQRPWRGRVSGADVGMKTAHAVCTLVSQQKDLISILRQVIEWGGDTDSVGAIAWGIASTRMKDDVPAFMEDALEPGGKYGAPFLRELGKRLMEAHQ